MSSRQATAHIDLDAIASNFNHVRQLAPLSKAMAVIKGDAYGHGAAKVAHKLKEADAFGVARISEAVKLREAGIGQPICLLEGVMDAEELNLASIYEFQVVVHSEYQLDLMSHASARRGVWLKIDTGMGRLGVRSEHLADTLKKLGKQTLLGLMTHLSEASNVRSEKTQQQIQQIDHLSKQLVGQYPAAKELSLANSAGILRHRASHKQWVRPGVMLYGATPFDDLQPIDALHPAMTFSAPIISVRTVKKGEAVGYGGTWQADQDTNVVVIAAGYADGYPRELENGTPVLINGQRRELVGRVSMDMICVKLHPGDVVEAGDRAILWGEGLPVEEIAQSAGTIAYTLLTGIGARVPRTYRDDASRG